MLAEYYPPDESQHFTSMLDGFSAAFGPETLTRDELQVVIEGEDANAFGPNTGVNTAQTTFYRHLKELVITGYYTSEIGMTKELRTNPFGPARYDIARSEVDRTWSD